MEARLLAGRVDPHVGDCLGSLLAAWHTGIATDTVKGLDDPEACEQLRVDPYYRTVAQGTPDLEPAITALISDMRERRRYFTHGDLSPKIVLVGASGLWIIDFEVAHVGDPAFDMAFLTTHLLLKGVHRPEDRDAYGDVCRRFWTAYRNGMHADHCDEPPHVLRHVVALLLARVDGKSPAEYLRSPEQTLARSLGRSLLLEPPELLDGAWQRLVELSR